MFRKSLMAMVLTGTMVVGNIFPSFAGYEDYWNVKADGYDEWFDSKESKFYSPSYLFSESGIDLPLYLSGAVYASPTYDISFYEDIPWCWVYGTVVLAEGYGNDGYDIWLTAVDSAVDPNETCGWTVTSATRLQSGDNTGASVNVGDTVVVIGYIMPYDDGFKNETYVTGGSYIVLTDKTFDEINQMYKDAVLKYQ